MKTLFTIFITMPVMFVLLFTIGAVFEIVKYVVGIKK